MSYSPAIAVLLTVLFTLTGVAGIYRSVFAVDVIDRVSNIVHVVMSVAMLSMPWSWGLKMFPAIEQIVVFSLAAAFYLALLILRPQAVAGPSAGHHSKRELLAYHAAMMGSMIVMGVLMLDMGGMSDMSSDSERMKGMGGMTHPATHGSGMSMHLSTWETVVSIMLGAGFVIATLWFLVDLARGLQASRSRTSDRRRTFDTSVSVLMAAGMSIAFFTM